MVNRENLWKRKKCKVTFLKVSIHPIYHYYYFVKTCYQIGSKKLLEIEPSYQTASPLNFIFTLTDIRFETSPTLYKVPPPPKKRILTRNVGGGGNRVFAVSLPSGRQLWVCVRTACRLVKRFRGPLVWRLTEHALRHSSCWPSEAIFFSRGCLSVDPCLLETSFTCQSNNVRVVTCHSRGLGLNPRLDKKM